MADNISDRGPPTSEPWRGPQDERRIIDMDRAELEEYKRELSDDPAEAMQKFIAQLHQELRSTRIVQDHANRVMVLDRDARGRRVLRPGHRDPRIDARLREDWLGPREPGERHFVSRFQADYDREWLRMRRLVDRWDAEGKIPSEIVEDAWLLGLGLDGNDLDKPISPTTIANISRWVVLKDWRPRIQQALKERAAEIDRQWFARYATTQPNTEEE